MSGPTDGPSQPSLNQVYETAGNPTDKDSIETARGEANAKADDDDVIASRGPGTAATDDEATKTSMARGIHGAPAGEETKGISQKQMDSGELDADQMGAPGEGKVADAVKGKSSGGGATQPGLETDLDRKKAEQAPARQAVQEEDQKEFDVGGVLGQRGGPANPVN